MTKIMKSGVKVSDIFTYCEIRSDAVVTRVSEESPDYNHESVGLLYRFDTAK